MKQKEIAEIHKKIITIAGNGNVTTPALPSPIPSPSTPPSVVSPSGLFGNGKIKQEKLVRYHFSLLLYYICLVFFN